MVSLLRIKGAFVKANLSCSSERKGESVFMYKVSHGFQYFTYLLWCYLPGEKYFLLIIPNFQGSI
jgi:hypothetical protein